MPNFEQYWGKYGTYCIECLKLISPYTADKYCGVCRKCKAKEDIEEGTETENIERDAESQRE